MENYTPKKSPTTQSVTGGAGDFSLGVLEKNADNSVRERETLMSRYNDKKKKNIQRKDKRCAGSSCTEHRLPRAGRDI